jgi:AraC-like DNA-binding protein/mannose-6-phosphate isomerase-like protein (cupin superfamily)
MLLLAMKTTLHEFGVDGLARFCHKIPTMRHDPAREMLVRTLAAGYSSGTVLESHSHDWAQLVYASEGVMTVQTQAGTWVVPSHRAVWIPAGVVHSIAMSGRVAMRTLYIAPRLLKALPGRCSVVDVSPMLRHLILHTVGQGSLRRCLPEHRRLVAFLIDQLRFLPTIALELPMPRDARALRVAVRLHEDPGDTLPVDTLARGAGASRRTLERLFRQETGMSLGRWRQQARLLHGMRLLASGEAVTAVALAVGYDSTSAFIAAFSRIVGSTPGRYYRTRR